MCICAMCMESINAMFEIEFNAPQALKVVDALFGLENENRGQIRASVWSTDPAMHD